MASKNQIISDVRSSLNSIDSATRKLEDQYSDTGALRGPAFEVWAKLEAAEHELHQAIRMINQL